MRRSNQVGELRMVLWMLFALALQGACSSKPVVPFEPVAVENPRNVRVYVYWPGQTWREHADRSGELQVDGVPVGILRYKTYLALELPPGNREFRITGDSAEADWEGLDKSFVMKLKSGEVEYVRFLVKFNQAENDWTHAGMSYVVQLLPRSPERARAEMAKLKPAEQ